MKLNLLARLKPDEGELIAWFGDAHLVKKLNGKFELHKVSASDRAAVREWCSLVLHAAVVAGSPPQQGRS